MRDMARQVPVLARTETPVRAIRPIPVSAWVIDSRGRDVQIAGRAVAWTSRAVNVHYYDTHGRQGFVWVWISAATRLEEA